MTRSDFDQLCIDWTITLGVYIVEAARTGGLLSLMELGQLSSRQREMLRSQKFIESEAYVRLNVARRLMYSALDSIPDVEVTEEEKLRNAEPVSARFAQAPEGLSKVILVVEDEDS